MSWVPQLLGCVAHNSISRQGWVSILKLGIAKPQRGFLDAGAFLVIYIRMLDSEGVQPSEVMAEMRAKARVHVKLRYLVVVASS
jgi:hypothetical protein